MYSLKTTPVRPKMPIKRRPASRNNVLLTIDLNQPNDLTVPELQDILDMTFSQLSKSPPEETRRVDIPKIMKVLTEPDEVLEDRSGNEFSPNINPQTRRISNTEVIIKSTPGTPANRALVERGTQYIEKSEWFRIEVERHTKKYGECTTPEFLSLVGAMASCELPVFVNIIRRCMTQARSRNDFKQYGLLLRELVFLGYNEFVTEVVPVGCTNRPLFVSGKFLRTLFLSPFGALQIRDNFNRPVHSFDVDTMLELCNVMVTAVEPLNRFAVATKILKAALESRNYTVYNNLIDQPVFNEVSEHALINSLVSSNIPNVIKIAIKYEISKELVIAAIKSGNSKNAKLLFGRYYNTYSQPGRRIPVAEVEDICDQIAASGTFPESWDIFTDFVKTYLCTIDPVDRVYRNIMFRSAVKYRRRDMLAYLFDSPHSDTIDKIPASLCSGETQSSFDKISLEYRLGKPSLLTASRAEDVAATLSMLETRNLLLKEIQLPVQQPKRRSTFSVFGKKK